MAVLNRCPRPDTRTCTTVAAPLVEVGVLLSKFMAAQAVGLSRIFGAGGGAPERINPWSDGLQVARIYARTDTAKVVELEASGNWADGQFVRNAVGMRRPAAAFPGRKAELSIAMPVEPASPKPARLGLVDLAPETRRHVDSRLIRAARFVPPQIMHSAHLARQTSARASLNGARDSLRLLPVLRIVHGAIIP